MYQPTTDALRGFSLPHAELYGKPHLGAHYKSFDAKSHALDDGARCAICGRPATNVHHLGQLKWGRCFSLRTPWGTHTLLPSLMAVCGSGTTGCHGAIHEGRIRVSWIWSDDLAAQGWWEGELLRAFDAHSSVLYDYGYYLIEHGDKSWEVRA